MYGSYSTTPAHTPTSPWVKDTQYLRLNCAHGLATVRNPPLTPFDSISSSLDNLTNSSSTELYNNWGTPSSKERCYSSDTSLRNFSRPDKKSSKLEPKFNTHSRSRCWPPAPSPPPAKPWTPPSHASNRLEPIASSTHFYFAKLFGMLATTKQWSTHEIISTVSCKLEDDHHHQIRPARILHLPISPTSWHDSTTRPCAMCMKNRSSKMEETTMGTTSEVTVFTP